MKIAVVGGGAAGLMAAIVASQKHKVTVFEKQLRVGKKLFASGNGKCNMTNSILTRENLEKPNDFYNCQQAKDVVSKFDYNDFMQFCKDMLAIET
ncbi:MAG: NAD(P)/FAD-dependent oxidoreductase, partial [Clostridia bacterium]|nr:NAD(P)/FAD-dependent oxidoreductase [Clostridia bacterium]